MRNRIIVQKYGGTSIGDVEKLKLIAKKISETKEKGFYPVVVVSAMGKTTDELVSMSKEVTFLKKPPDLREKDILLYLAKVRYNPYNDDCIESIWSTSRENILNYCQQGKGDYLNSEYHFFNKT